MKRAAWTAVGPIGNRTFAALAAVALIAGTALASSPRGREAESRHDRPDIVLTGGHDFGHHGGHWGHGHDYGHFYGGVVVAPRVYTVPPPVVVVPAPAVVPPPVYPYPDYRVYRYYPGNDFYYRGPKVGFSIHF